MVDEDRIYHKAIRCGQVKVNKIHECIHCGRLICKNEFAWVKALLCIEGKSRQVLVEYSCCKAIR